jgi:hypothetical protein
MNPDNVVEHPSCGRVLKALACVVWTCGRMFLEGMANPNFPGRIDQPADRHPHQQRQDACRLVAIPRGGQKLWVVQAAQPAFRPGLACIAGSQLRRGQQGGIAFMRSEEDTTMVVEQGLTGGDPHGERAFERIDDLVRWSTWAWAPPLGIAWGGGADGALGHEGGRHAVGTDRQGLLRLGGPGTGWAAQCLDRVDVLRTVRQPLCVHGARRLRLARRGVAAHPARLYAPITRSPHVRTLALRERGQRRRIGLGSYRLGFAPGRRDPGAPLRPRLGELLKVLGTREGAVRDAPQRAIGHLPRRHRRGDELATVLHIPTMPPEGLHEPGDARVLFDQHVPQHGVAGRSLLPTGAPGEVHDVRIRRRVTLVAPLDMTTGASEMHQAGRHASGLRRGRGHEAVAFGHPLGIEGIHGPTPGVIVEWLGSHAGRDEAGGRLLLEEARHELERWGDTPQPLAHHRVDGVTHREVSHVWVVWRGVVEDLATAECVAHASHKAEVVEHVTVVQGVVRHPHLLCW